MIGLTEERFGAQCRVDFFMAHIFVPMIVAKLLRLVVGKDFNCRTIALLTLRAV